MSQRILILSHDNKIGDAIVATGLFKPLRTHWPDCEIGVLCGGSNAALYRHHPDVKWLHVANSRNLFARMWASLKARWVGYDMVVHFGFNLANSSEQIVLRVVNAKQRFLFAKHPVKSLPNDVVMDGALSSPHYSARHLRFLHAINASPRPYQYDIQLDENADAPKAKFNGPLMVINSQGSTANRSLPPEWLRLFVAAVFENQPNTYIKLLSASPAHEAVLNAELAGFGERVQVCRYEPSVSHSLKVIRSADVVVTPDTYAVHAASAWNIPVVALYLPNGPTMVWTPLSETYVQIEAAPGKAVSDITVAKVVEALNQMTASPKCRVHINASPT
jgi:ADP-heptose:LPS heptosyltransferase